MSNEILEINNKNVSLLSLFLIEQTISGNTLFDVFSFIKSTFKYDNITVNISDDYFSYNIVNSNSNSDTEFKQDDLLEIIIKVKYNVFIIIKMNSYYGDNYFDYIPEQIKTITTLLKYYFKNVIQNNINNAVLSSIKLIIEKKLKKNLKLFKEFNTNSDDNNEIMKVINKEQILQFKKIINNNVDIYKLLVPEQLAEHNEVILIYIKQYINSIVETLMPNDIRVINTIKSSDFFINDHKKLFRVFRSLFKILRKNSITISCQAAVFHCELIFQIDGSLDTKTITVLNSLSDIYYLLPVQDKLLVHTITEIREISKQLNLRILMDTNTKKLILTFNDILYTLLIKFIKENIVFVYYISEREHPTSESKKFIKKINDIGINVINTKNLNYLLNHTNKNYCIYTTSSNITLFTGSTIVLDTEEKHSDSNFYIYTTGKITDLITTVYYHFIEPIRIVIVYNDPYYYNLLQIFFQSGNILSVNKYDKTTLLGSVMPGCVYLVDHLLEEIVIPIFGENIIFLGKGVKKTDDINIILRKIFVVYTNFILYS